MVREELFNLSRNRQPFSQERASALALQRKLLTCLSKKANMDETELIMEGVEGCRVALGKGQLRQGHVKNDKDFGIYSVCDRKTLDN